MERRDFLKKTANAAGLAALQELSALISQP